VYDALQLDWDPGTAGAITNEVPGTTWEQAVDALIAELPEHEPAELDASTLAMAQRYAPEHLG
jgi:hypothetical protein